MIFRGSTRFLFSFLLLAMANHALFAQSERGAITGTVQDASGASVEGSKVTIRNEATNVVLEATTNSAGEYTVPSLQPGTYTVRAERNGFRPTQETGLTVNAAITVRADMFQTHAWARLRLGWY